MHQGGALGGHYITYIKSFENNRWYNCNDFNVSPIPFDCVEYVFGEMNPKYDSGKSAYMLIYK